MLRWTDEQLAAYRELQRGQAESKKSARPVEDTARPKYRNKKTVIGNITFDSKLEATRYVELKRLEEAKAISNLLLQVPFSLAVNGCLICKYIADFTYRDIDGRLVVEDAKGISTRDYLLKKKLMKALHCIDIIEYRRGSGKKSARRKKPV